jgi:hypothetical protein
MSRIERIIRRGIHLPVEVGEVLGNSLIEMVIRKKGSAQQL